MYNMKEIIKILRNRDISLTSEMYELKRTIKELCETVLIRSDSNINYSYSHVMCFVFIIIFTFVLYFNCKTKEKIVWVNNPIYKQPEQQLHVVID